MPLRIWFSMTVAALAVAWLLLPGGNGITITSSHANAGPTGVRRTASPANPGPKAKVDPVAKNGPIFQGWTTPRFALVLSGLQDGYLEPCGCAGLENQKGGMSRRFSLLKQLRQKGWPLASLDVGGQVRHYGRQSEIKFGIATEGFATMGYEVVGLGTNDLRLPTNELLAATANLADPTGASRFVSANVGLFGFESAATPRFRTFEVAGQRLAVTSVLSDSHAKELKNDEITILPAAQALQDILPAMKRAADILILLSYSNNEEAAALATKFPDFQIIATAGGADEPPAQPIPVPGSKTVLVDVGHKGMYAIVLGNYDNPKQSWRYQRVPLDARFPDSPEMKQLMVAYQGQLQQEGFAGLGLQPAPHPLANAGDRLTNFAGSASCQECHPTTFGIWSKTPHAHATETLTKLDPPRHFDPECVSCHATGWNAQEYFPYTTGFADLETTPMLVSNGCENCHGPAAAHVAAEQSKGTGRNAVQRASLRQRLRLTKATIESTCEKCHDHDNSPEFDFDRYWPKVEHHGKK